MESPQFHRRRKVILVTGAAGFIGSHVTQALIEAGHFVLALDSFDDYYDPNLKRANVARFSPQHFKLVEGDIRDQAALNRAFDAGPFAAIVHLAARAGVRPSVDNPLLYESVNVAGTTALLEITRRNPTTHFVFGSSSSVYRALTHPPFTEDTVADRPTSPYAATKRSGELTAHAFHHVYGTPVTCLRFFTVYGPRQRPEMAIHKFTHAIHHSKPVTLYGDGQSMRDYTYVDDIVQGVLRATETPNGFRVFNLGSSHVTSLRRLTEMIAELLGKELIVENAPDQPGDVRITHADITLATDVLGYKPLTTIDEGLAKFVDWYLTTPRAGMKS